MKVRIIENSRIPVWCGADAITIYPFIFLDCSKQQAIDNHILNHECVHVLQIRKLGWLKFYCSYLWQFFIEYMACRNKQQAYESISYEVEAYSQQDIQPLLLELF